MSLTYNFYMSLWAQMWSTWVFPKWLSLNSTNSVNHDKIQKWYGYQMYYPSGNKYISSTKCIFITTTGQVAIATHHSEQIPTYR